MEIILQIPAQAATRNEPRQMTLVSVNFKGDAVAEARDAKLPARIVFSDKDLFPWDQFLRKAAVIWQLSRPEFLPAGFRLRRPMPQELIDAIPKLDRDKSLTLLKRLGKAGAIGAFR